MNTVLATANQPDLCGRMFSKEVLESIAEQANKTDVLGYVGSERENDVQRVAFKVDNVNFEDNELKGKVTFLGTPQGKHLQQVAQCVELQFGINGTGVVNSDHHVLVFNLQSYRCSPRSVMSPVTSETLDQMIVNGRKIVLDLVTKELDELTTSELHRLRTIIWDMKQSRDSKEGRDE
jgi:hypothetical protein